MSNTTPRRILVVMLALAVAVSGAGLVMGAAPSVDTETTNTAKTSEVTEDSAQNYNETTTSNISWSADSNSSKIIIKQNGTTLYTATPDNYSSVNTTGDSTPETWYYNVSMADDGSDYDGLEVGANENASLTATLVNNTNADSPDKTTVNWTFVNGEAMAFIAGETADTKVEENDSGILATAMNFNPLSNDSDPGAARVEDTTTITNNTTQVVLDFENQNLSESASHVASNKEGFTTVAYAEVDGQLVPVIVGSASDVSWLDTSEEAYISMASDGNQATLHNADQLVDSSQTVDVAMTVNEDMGWASVSMLRDYGASFPTAITAGSLYDNGDPTYVDA